MFFLYPPPSGADSVHTLTCATMLLNTDLHGQVSSWVGACGTEAGQGPG